MASKKTTTDEAGQATPAESTPRVTKIEKLRSAFDEKSEWTEGELLEHTGYDGPNLKTAIGILRNPGRTTEANLMNILFDPDRKVFYKAELGEKAKPKTKPAEETVPSDAGETPAE